MSFRQPLSDDELYQYFLAQEADFNAEQLAFLDRGIEQSPYRTAVDAYSNWLRSRSQIPVRSHVRSQPYPQVDVRPVIDPEGLDFLHPDVKQACLCLGMAVSKAESIRTQWFGRQALSNVEFWSTTKIVPLLNLITRANRLLPTTPIDQLQIRDRGCANSYRFSQLADDVVTYTAEISSSNAISAGLKRFNTPLSLQQWLRELTGNHQLMFQGRYGEPPFFQQPELINPSTNQVVLTTPNVEHRGNNAISAYDLTRLMTMLGWHWYLAATSRLPGAQWHSLSSLVTPLGRDPARYVDLAFKQLGVEPIRPVILSKMGFGRSQIRDRTELSYTAFVQFGLPVSGTAHSFSFTLLVTQALSDPDEEARRADARMATEVTRLIDRVLDQRV